MIGDMRHRLTLQEPLRTPDGGGGFSLAWENVTSHPVVFAAVESLGGREQLRFRQLAASVTHRIRIHYRSDVTPDMRLTDGAKIYRILAAYDPDGRMAWLDILAESGTA